MSLRIRGVSIRIMKLWKITSFEWFPYKIYLIKSETFKEFKLFEIEICKHLKWTKNVIQTMW